MTAAAFILSKKRLFNGFFKDIGAVFPSKTVSTFFDTTELL